MSESLAILGVRHHGPGSARSVVAALDDLQPDLVLIEGPPDADGLIALASDEDMAPPVAILVYVPDEPRRAVYYPFAEYSPEWQALRWALRAGVPARFMDLPQCSQLALDLVEKSTDFGTGTGTEPDQEAASPETRAIEKDPLGFAAQAAGYSDGERWWEHMIEQRRDHAGVFSAVLELMTALRAEVKTGGTINRRELLREAHMRQVIRIAQKSGHQRIAAICGAWHAPALDSLLSEKDDVKLLKGLAKVKVSATWVPWSTSRLTYASGYGAGVNSPGYYQYLWSATENVTAGWMIRVAALLREQDLDAPVSSVIDAVALAGTLAALRNFRTPGLEELNDAACASLCFGDLVKMQLIGRKLIVGEVLGKVPESAPMVPLQRDLQQLQKRLRLQPEASRRTIDLDLRKPVDLERSHLLHRLLLVGITWGTRGEATGKGTFHEIWELQWHPEFSVAVIEASVWGNTVLAAATAKARNSAAESIELAAVTRIVENVLLADLPEALELVMNTLQNLAAVTSDVAHLMDAIPPLAAVVRYGNVRQTDTGMVKHVVDGMVARACIGLPSACSVLNDEAAEEMFGRFIAVHDSILMLQDADYLAAWRSVLSQLAAMPNVNGLIAGRCCRLMFDQNMAGIDEVAVRMNQALSRAVDPAQEAAWIEGFLRGSGQVLLHDNDLWRIIDSWVAALGDEAFTPVLPLLRRTFSTFAAPERRQMGNRAKLGSGTGDLRQPDAKGSDVDLARAELVLPILRQLLGL